MFSLDRFIDDCIAAVREDPTHRAVHAVVTAAFTDPAAVAEAVGVPTEAKLAALHRSDELTILNVVWKPGMTNIPHNHRTWAVIGIYQGREDNAYWRRVAGAADGRIERAGGQTMVAGDVVPLGSNIIHSVTNPLDGLTGALHVYGGDFFTIERSEWNSDTLAERPYDPTRSRAAFGIAS